MSLINDMLKDLDRDPPATEPALPAGLRERQGSDATTGGRLYLLPAIALLAVAYALLVEWNLLGLMPEKSTIPTEIPQPIALNSKWLNVQAAQSAGTSASGEEEHAQAAVVAEASAQSAEQSGDAESVHVNTYEKVAAGSAFSASPIQSSAAGIEAVQQLLTEAADALAKNQLTTPTGNNAYQFYKSVLVIDPANAEARAGIESIQQTYLQWLDKALAEQRFAAAQGYWQKAKTVGVDQATLESYQAALQDEPTSRQVAKPSSAQPQAKITPALRLNDEQMAERLRSDGRRREQDALELLTHTSAAPQTAVALADFYAEQGAAADLRRLADRLHHQSVRAYVLAQLFLLDGQEATALEALAAVEFSGVAEQQRMRLLAGLQQKAGHYAAAAELYATLVSATSNNVGDWLGLAVSADKEGLTGTALDAYAKVLVLGHPDLRVMQYARQRQQDLSFTALNSR